MSTLSSEMERRPVILLAGDIGATNSRISLYEGQQSHLTKLTAEVFPSQHFESIDAVLLAFLKRQSRMPDFACLGVPGPVVNGKCLTTNLPWILEDVKIASTLGIRKAWLLNDLEAIAHGVPYLAPGELHSLTGFTVAPGGNAAVIAPGSGLGEAILYWDGEHYHPFGSEGGHGNFAPSNELEIDLLRYLLGIFSAVSWERLLSGPGIVNLYSFLKESGRFPEPAWLKRLLEAAPDPAAVISEEAFAGRAPICQGALDLFAELLGSEAGNLALQVMAVGGIYIGGGIVPKFLPGFQKDLFMRGFLNKGRLRKVLESIPVQIILDDEVGLKGAAHFAFRCARLLRGGVKEAESRMESIRLGRRQGTNGRRNRRVSSATR